MSRGIGPMFGQAGFFVKPAGQDLEDKRPRERGYGNVKPVRVAFVERPAVKAGLNVPKRD